MENICENFKEVSPENKDCAWCGEYQINLDRDGKMCGRCKSDEKFREMLLRTFMLRFGKDCGKAFWCEIFKTATDEEQCRRCKSDPEYRSFLFGQYMQREKSDVQEKKNKCVFAGETLGVEERKCCGGKVRREEIFLCEKNGEVTIARCQFCKDWMERKENA
jgi:hypothetical protein